MITEIRGYAKAVRFSLMRVTAVILVLAVLCAGTAFAATGDLYIVDVYEGPQVTRVETAEKDAYAVVAEAGIQLSEQDKLILGDFAAGEDSRIIVCRASHVRFVDADGNVTDLIFAGTVGELIAEQGIVLNDHLVSSVNVKAVVTDELKVEILNSYDLTINVDGEKRHVKSTAANVGELLTEQEIVLDDDDEVSPSASTPLSNNLVIDVLRVEYVFRDAEETVKYSSKTSYSSALEKGTSKVTQKGVNGTKTVTYRDKVVNGTVRSTTVEKEVVTKQPVDEITTIGTFVKTTVPARIQKNAAPISELTLPSKYSIGENGVPTSYQYTITGKAAAYCVPGGTTATGKSVKPGYVAVDPNQIPYGTEMWIVSNDGIVYGYAIAADTGGFVGKGKFTIDLYMNSTSQCYQWGSRNVTIYVL